MNNVQTQKNTSVSIHPSYSIIVQERVLQLHLPVFLDMMMIHQRRFQHPLVILVLWTLFFVQYDDRIAVRATKINHRDRSAFQCDNDDASTSLSTVGPNFFGIPFSSNQTASIATLPDREYRILSYYAQTPLPLNDSSDDPQPFDETLTPTNPYWNSRADTIAIVNRYISRIVLGCYDNADLDQIFLDESTRPFAIPGTSFRVTVCERDGDYDFVTIDLLQLLYVSRQYPGSLSDDVYVKIRDELLPIFGLIGDNSILTPCRVKFGPIRLSVTVKNFRDTENHILQTQISRYLTNQLLLEVYPEYELVYNNTLNGNTEWMLEYLSSFLNDLFYEYNSRPYQLFTVKALSVLHSYALDTDVVLVTEMILDIITSYSSMQMSTLRRFAPFRRQPQYLQETKSWEGESEMYRLAVLVGNYAISSGTTSSQPQVQPEIPVFNDYNSVSTLATKYRLQTDFMWNVIYNDLGEYFISNHDIVEMYYSSRHVLISAGGNTASGAEPSLEILNRFCIFKRCLISDPVLRFLIANVLVYFDATEGERGWSRPTTIVPTNEDSTDLNDMMRFDGHRDPEQVSLSRNLCVAPNFACGLQMQYGNIIEPIIDDCSVVVDVDIDWRFFDFSGNDGRSTCPKYGYYMAVYNRPCIECTDKADQYGFLEISENIRTMTFETFQQRVLTNNPNPFLSDGVQIYIPINGQAITFEINPVSDDQSQIIQVDGVDYGNPLYLDRYYRNWPLAWSANKSIHSVSMKGRWTFDISSTTTTTSTVQQRLIYDVTDPLHPKRITSRLPLLIKHPIVDTKKDGRYFDDSGAILDDDSIQSILFNSNIFGVVTGFQMVWRRSQLQSNYGSVSNRFRFLYRRSFYEFEPNETIVEVGIGGIVQFVGKRRVVNRIRIVTNRSRTIIVGDGSSEQAVYNDKNIVAFHGYSDDTAILQLGVISLPE